MEDWQMANFLMMSRLSMRAIGNFLSLGLTKKMPISFQTAVDLRSRIKLLPSGPAWKCRIVDMSHPMKQPIHLYFHDSLDCIEQLFNRSRFAGVIDFSPYQLYTTSERIMRVYTEWMSSDGAWELQVEWFNC
ncbi:hypothetical protein JVT61DRAFT_8364 [Boletus reticuloceps]|uniref:Uncharacterized protein n=1 Tax=Boletus reticuloceps TaxID=495285 RepID=A0A8I3AED6_9AGAM|nr:hypothetical protein JVT61DRAFT_8364 [Boletus reticuloceps]